MVIQEPGFHCADEDDEAARIKSLFFEADRLDDIAYRLFDESQKDNGTWIQFIEAKAQADAKRTQAYQSWIKMCRRRGR
jgi:hypothetical protein